MKVCLLYFNVKLSASIAAMIEEMSKLFESHHYIMFLVITRCPVVVTEH
jgi:hypothetical protein